MRLSSSVRYCYMNSLLAKQALSRKERNDYELEKIGAIVGSCLTTNTQRHNKNHLNVKEAKKEKEIKKKEERLKKRFVLIMKLLLYRKK